MKRRGREESKRPREGREKRKTRKNGNGIVLRKAAYFATGKSREGFFLRTNDKAASCLEFLGKNPYFIYRDFYF